jgi:hypothetical protein
MVEALIDAIGNRAIGEERPPASLDRIDDGILEVKNALENGIITDNVTTKTVDYYKYLINADKVLSEVKLKNKLF